MAVHLHHVHLFAADLDATVAWYRDNLGGEVFYDGDFGGARNVFMKIGTGRVHFYDQPPREYGRNAVHHVGMRTDDLPGLVARLRANGVPLRSDIREFGNWRYIMCGAPDGVLLELFQIDTEQMPEPLARFWRDETA
jgi:catechol 2,3-dioxygenase-like lactoylglutathione lyase family enzyme